MPPDVRPLPAARAADAVANNRQNAASAPTITDRHFSATIFGLLSTPARKRRLTTYQHSDLNKRLRDRTQAVVTAYKTGSSHQTSARPIIVNYQQARVEDAPTRNAELLAAEPFLTHRSLEPQGVINRFLLKPWIIDYFESSEANSLS